MTSHPDAGLTQAVKEIARQHGAMLVGVASVDRYDPMPRSLLTPRGLSPLSGFSSPLSISRWRGEGGEGGRRTTNLARTS